MHVYMPKIWEGGGGGIGLTTALTVGPPPPPPPPLARPFLNFQSPGGAPALSSCDRSHFLLRRRKHKGSVLNNANHSRIYLLPSTR